MQIVFDKKVLEYQGTLGCKKRLIDAHSFLKNHYKFIKPELKISEPIVHTKELIQKVKTRTFHDFDTPAYENIFDYACLALNGTIKAQEIQGFSIIEPPGHHAGKDFLGGFCYFNNIAESVKRSKLKTLIIDIDGHHGNGTQDIFQNSKDVYYISLHQSPCYPGTGLKSKNNIFNFPLSKDCGEEKYLETLNHAINIATKNFKPEQIAVSAGFDTYRGDLASLGLEKSSYKKIAKIIKQLAQKNNAKVFGVLEGGYTTNLGELIHEFILGIK